MKDEKQYLAQPIKLMFDVQLGPDGHPWIRMQFATPGMSAQIVFPTESSEEVISTMTQGIRHASKNALKRSADIIQPDFTGIKGAFDNG
jgi:hypothetical protein